VVCVPNALAGASKKKKSELLLGGPEKKSLPELLAFPIRELYYWSCLIHALAGRTFPAEERGSAAGSLLASHRLKSKSGLGKTGRSPPLPLVRRRMHSDVAVANRG
jgi:hypothetical protein